MHLFFMNNVFVDFHCRTVSLQKNIKNEQGQFRKTRKLLLASKLKTKGCISNVIRDDLEHIQTQVHDRTVESGTIFVAYETMKQHNSNK